MATEKTARKNHGICMENRSEFRATGVTRLDFFSEETVVALTDFGNMSVKGEGLYVDGLNAVTGELFIRGKINAVAYYEQVEGKSWLKRIFR